MQEYVEEDWQHALSDLNSVLCSKYLAGHSKCNSIWLQRKEMKKKKGTKTKKVKDKFKRIDRDKYMYLAGHSKCNSIWLQRQNIRKNDIINKIQRKRKGQRQRQIQKKRQGKYHLIEEGKSFIFQMFGRCIFYTFLSEQLPEKAVLGNWRKRSSIHWPHTLLAIFRNWKKLCLPKHTRTFDPI